jgi:hypothetical protein
MVRKICVCFSEDQVALVLAASVAPSENFSWPPHVLKSMAWERPRIPGLDDGSGQHQLLSARRSVRF